MDVAVACVYPLPVRTCRLLLARTVRYRQVVFPYTSWARQQPTVLFKARQTRKARQPKNDGAICQFFLFISQRHTRRGSRRTLNAYHVGHDMTICQPRGRFNWSDQLAGPMMSRQQRRFTLLKSHDSSKGAVKRDFCRTFCWNFCRNFRRP